jgi:nucleoid-associated protein YgaU
VKKLTSPVGLLLGILLLLCTSDSSGLADDTPSVLVTPGNTLQLISLASYGTSHRWKEIAALNHIETPYLIRVNQTIKLPEPKTINIARANFLLWRQSRRKFKLPLEGTEYKLALASYYSKHNNHSRGLASPETGEAEVTTQTKPAEKEKLEQEISTEIERNEEILPSEEKKIPEPVKDVAPPKLTEQPKIEEQKKVEEQAKIAEQKRQVNEEKLAEQETEAEKQAQDIKKWSDNGGENLLKEKNYDKAFKGFPVKPETEAVPKMTAAPSGVLWIEGTSADLIYRYMAKVPSVHSTIDLNLPPPKEFSFESMERKVGKNIACVRQPLVNASSTEYTRDEEGKVVLKTRCLGHSGVREKPAN